MKPSGNLRLPLGSVRWYYRNMAKVIKGITKKRGRRTTGRDPMMTLRMPVGLRRTIERWAARKDVTRSEAIRALILRGLKK
jgi:hypothetical protein